MTEYDIPIYMLNDENTVVDNIGVVIVNNHCIVILPKS